MIFESTLLSVLAIVLPILHLFGFASAVEALFLSRSSQGAIAWCMFLVMFPYLGLPAYWLFGRAKFRGYREQIARVTQHRESSVTWYREQVSKSAVVPHSDEPKQLETFTRIAKSSFLGGNSAELLIDGEATFQSIFGAIDQATSSVLVEFFIIENDALGQELKQKLSGAAQRGVAVYLLYDEVGSHSLSKSFIKELSDSGVRVAPFNMRQGWRGFFRINFRNHRKIVVVDGQIAFIGGHNVGDEYLGLNKRFGRWRDTHMRISGPAVLQAKALFFQDWVWATGSVPEVGIAAPATAGDVPVLTLGTGPADEQERCLHFFLHCITSAKSRVWIASPYFVPDDALLSALQLAAMRGVDVRILLPAKMDHILVWLASFFYVPEVTSYGVKVFRFTDGFMHQKVVVVDDVVSAIGTANFDNRSFRLNFEVMSIFADQKVTAEVARMLESDFALSVNVSKEVSSNYPFWKRVGSRVARLFSPIL